MRSGRIEEADAISISRFVLPAAVTQQSSSWLRTADTKETVAKVRKVIQCSVDVLTAQTLNDYYAAVSTDTAFTSSKPKLTVTTATPSISDVEVFNLLDRLRHTATALDSIPA